MMREKTKLNATTVPLPAMTQVPPPPPSIRQSAPDPTASTPTLAACDLSDTLPSLEQIGKAKVTTLSHVPKALRTIWADILAESCNRILREPENLDAWRKWLMLPKSSLISPPVSRNHTWRDKVAFSRSKLNEWSKGNVSSLWDCVLKSQRKSKKSQPSQADFNVKRARYAIREGQYRKASQALTSNGLADQSSATMERLLSLHPQTAAPTLPPSPVPAPISFTTKVVLKAIMSFPATSAAGPSGLKATHLK